jgi:acetylornithine deacetylase/succinyl-diaminopimelate desuccinylase-like protein
MTKEWSNQRAAERLMGLVRLPTVATESPFSTAYEGWNLDRAGTFAQAEAYLTTWLMSFADEVGTQDVVVDGRVLRNVWAHVPGKRSDTAVLLEGHYDVVALDGNFTPSLSEDEERILGRGTCDMKGGLVAGITALEDMIDSGQQPRVDTYILATCEEEVEAGAIQAFLKDRPDWSEKVEFAVCLEPCFEKDVFHPCVRHPGIACLVAGMDAPQTGEASVWLDLCIETGQTTPHASREPVYLDPNEVLLRVLERFPQGRVGLVESDRPMDKEANAISSFSHALIDAGVGEAALRVACRDEIDAAVGRIRDEERRAAAAKAAQFSIDLVTEARPAFDVHEFAATMMALKAAATASHYTNALYGRTPFAFAILALEDGRAQAKIDLRPDDRLGREIEELIGRDAFAACSFEIRWNDPGLEMPGVEDDERFQHFMDCCQKVWPNTVIEPHSGWTEAAFMSKGLDVPVVIAGPGQMQAAHKQDEYVALRELEAVYAILQAFLAEDR